MLCLFILQSLVPHSHPYKDSPLSFPHYNKDMSLSDKQTKILRGKDWRGFGRCRCSPCSSFSQGFMWAIIGFSEELSPTPAMSICAFEILIFWPRLQQMSLCHWLPLRAQSVGPDFLSIQSCSGRCGRSVPGRAPSSLKMRCLVTSVRKCANGDPLIMHIWGLWRKRCIPSFSNVLPTEAALWAFQIRERSTI